MSRKTPCSFGFGKENRLKKPGEIRNVLFSRNRFSGSGVDVKWVPRGSGPQTPSRLCVVVSKKSLRSAVDRNRAKRFVKEFFRLNKKKIRPGVDVSIQVKSRNPLCYKEIEEILNTIFKRAGLF